jgi:NAD+ diphosphatase
LSEPRPPRQDGPPGPNGPLRRPLAALALARGTVDRSAVRRSDSEWLTAAWARDDTRVLVIDDGRTLVRFGDAGAGLVFVAPAQAPDGERHLLGVDGDGHVYFSVTAPLPEGAGTDEVQPAGLRRAGALLDDRDAGLLTHAVALANWHRTHTHCPRCGSLTDPVMGGHSRVCRTDGSEHFPRTDPAVIMLVTDPDERALLARNRAWPPGRVSLLAGFVEPGESAERAVAREVAEETGIAVGDVAYLGSQPWPMPQSLMLGFRAAAPGGQPIRVDEEEISEARWFSRDELRAGLASGEVLMPPPVSIAHRIIEAWYGEELP